MDFDPIKFDPSAPSRDPERAGRVDAEAGRNAPTTGPVGGNVLRRSCREPCTPGLRAPGGIRDSGFPQNWL